MTDTIRNTRATATAIVILINFSLAGATALAGALALAGATALAVALALAGAVAISSINPFVFP